MMQRKLFMGLVLLLLVANAAYAQQTKGKKKQRLKGTDTLITEKSKSVYLPVDTDNDGTPDHEDDCIAEPGRKENRGCPDSDKDGIPDKADACPDIKGVTSAKGCPDRDADGIADDRDLCPDVFGSGKNGCAPVSDSVTLPAPPIAFNEIEERVARASQNIRFGSANANIHPECYFALDIIIEVLLQNPTLLVEIEGHTDNVGGRKQNILLSQQRADACKAYLISKGIEVGRIISSIGFGAMNPIADNNTYEGRSLNRRTEFFIKKGEEDR